MFSPLLVRYCAAEMTAIISFISFPFFWCFPVLLSATCQHFHAHSFQTYLDYFSQGLEFEYRDQGITVQCLMPFYVATRMTRYSETLSRTSLFIPSAATFASSAVQTLGFSSRTTGYFPHTFLVGRRMIVVVFNVSGL